ncbi:hypothetical protein Emag_007424 [Eimeria magna]
MNSERRREEGKEGFFHFMPSASSSAVFQFAQCLECEMPLKVEDVALSQPTSFVARRKSLSVGVGREHALPIVNAWLEIAYPAEGIYPSWARSGSASAVAKNNEVEGEISADVASRSQNCFVVVLNYYSCGCRMLEQARTSRVPKPQQQQGQHQQRQQQQQRLHWPQQLQIQSLKQCRWRGRDVADFEEATAL